MSAPAGWYPDPSGGAGLRFWDGRTWTNQTQQTPAPLSGPPGPGPGRSRGGLIAAVIGAVLLLLVTVLVVRALRPSSNDEAGADPTSTVSGWDEQGRPSKTPSTAESTQTARSSTVPCPELDPNARETHPDDGRVHGGKLAFDLVGDGYGQPTSTWALPFMTDTQRQSQMTEPGGESWSGVGQVRRTEGFETPKAAAIHALECTIRPDLFDGFSSRTDKVSKPVVIGGKKGWKLSSEIRVDSDTLSVEGDLVTFVFIDDGRHEWLSGFVAITPIGDAPRNALAERVEASLTVDP